MLCEIVVDGCVVHYYKAIIFMCEAFDERLLTSHNHIRIT